MKVRLCDAVDSALFISGYDYLGALESFRAGHFQVQDISSMEVANGQIRKRTSISSMCVQHRAASRCIWQISLQERDM